MEKKYRYYTSSKQSRITVPRQIAKALKWEDKDPIHIEFDTYYRKKGIFLYKNGGGTTVSYTSEPSSLTIPLAIAQALHWNDKDTIKMEYRKKENISGLFLAKKK